MMPKIKPFPFFLAICLSGLVHGLGITSFLDFVENLKGANQPILTIELVLESSVAGPDPIIDKPQVALSSVNTLRLFEPIGAPERAADNWLPLVPLKPAVDLTGNGLILFAPQLDFEAPIQTHPIQTVPPTNAQLSELQEQLTFLGDTTLELVRNPTPPKSLAPSHPAPLLKSPELQHTTSLVSLLNAQGQQTANPTVIELESFIPLRSSSTQLKHAKRQVNREPSHFDDSLQKTSSIFPLEDIAPQNPQVKSSNISLEKVTTLSAPPVDNQVTENANTTTVANYREPELGNKPPQYPLRARQKGQEGKVIILVAVTERGKPGAISITESSGVKILDSAAERAIEGWTFRPALRRGVPVDSSLLIPITFRLQD
tara:strand:- start:492 stop:1610 length:1119 start_codon:yes stop_codon:yes gene_type:complete